jgi:hypothetical protein
MVTISVGTNDFVPAVIHVITGLITVTCLFFCAVEIHSLLQMELWLVGALVAFFINRFGSGIIGRLLAF